MPSGASTTAVVRVIAAPATSANTVRRLLMSAPDTSMTRAGSPHPDVRELLYQGLLTERWPPAEGLPGRSGPPPWTGRLGADRTANDDRLPMHTMSDPAAANAPH